MPVNVLLGASPSLVYCTCCWFACYCCYRRTMIRYYCRWDFTWEVVTPGTFMSITISLEVATSGPPNAYTASTNFWCNPGVQRTRGCFIWPPPCEVAWQGAESALSVSDSGGRGSVVRLDVLYRRCPLVTFDCNMIASLAFKIKTTLTN